MRRRAAISLVLLLLGFGTLAAQHVVVPVQNWTVPAYRAASTSGGISTMTDVSGQRTFVPISPCRIADTRAIDGFGGQAGGPVLTSFVNRDFQITGSPAVVPGPPAGCGGGTVPADADAVSIQFTVVTPTAAGNLVAWQAGAAAPTVSVLNWDAGTIAQGNGTIVPLGGPGAVTVRLNTAAAGQSAHLIIDINGYFSESSSSTTANLQIYSTVTTHTIFGNNTGGGNGVEGFASLGTNNRAGVFGRQGLYIPLDSYAPAGVRGQGASYGVVGISSSEGVTGGLTTVGGSALNVYGILGFASGTDPNCVGGGSCGGPWGVFAGGNIGATGTKHFLEPHPSDPKIAIGYISLEGPEAGTYFRGRARFQNGMARIAVPEHFRLVTDSEGLTVQITPIGGMATVGVLRADLNEIVVQASRNLEFSYLVQGVRASFKDVSPYRYGNDFMPRNASARIPLSLSPRQRELLIENGTYNADGTVNMETARRAGWARVWEDREQPTPAPSPE